MRKEHRERETQRRERESQQDRQVEMERDRGRCWRIKNSTEVEIKTKYVSIKTD